MAKLDKEELAKLKPAERIKRLKKIEEESRKQIEEAEKLIKRSESELETEEAGRKVAVPETKPVEISELFEAPPSELEKAAGEAKAEEPTQEQLQYMVQQAYDEVAELAYQEPTEDVLEKVDAIGERLEKIKYHTTTEDMVNKVVATRSLIHKIKKYHQPD